jgi:FMN-dependent NADH-azoreductase
MTREFVQQWQQRHSNDTIAYRDVGRNPIPHVDEAWIAAAFSSPEQYTPNSRMQFASVMNWSMNF